MLIPLNFFYKIHKFNKLLNIKEFFYNKRYYKKFNKKISLDNAIDEITNIALSNINEYKLININNKYNNILLKNILFNASLITKDIALDEISFKDNIFYYYVKVFSFKLGDFYNYIIILNCDKCYQDDYIFLIHNKLYEYFIKLGNGFNIKNCELMDKILPTHTFTQVLKFGMYDKRYEYNYNKIYNNYRKFIYFNDYKNENINNFINGMVYYNLIKNNLYTFFDKLNSWLWNNELYVKELDIINTGIPNSNVMKKIIKFIEDN